MSRTGPGAIDFDPAELPPPICRFCGDTIDEHEQDCAARAEGVCRP